MKKIHFDIDLIYDLAMRLPVILVFGVLALMRLNAITTRLHNPLDAASLLRISTDMAVLLFLVLIVVLTTIRLKPARRSAALLPNLAALAGTYLSMALVMLPAAPLSPALQALATVAMLVGASLSFYTLSWLGRAFSLLPEARTLVTSGPYAIIRHPLYVCEEITILGAALSVASWPALAIIALQWGFQLWRMHNEERVLATAFPAEYAAYAARVPRLYSFTWAKAASARLRAMS